MMKLTKSYLRELIIEELGSTTSKEEPSAPEEPELRKDVERARQKMDRIPGFEQVLRMINTREELEEIILLFIKMASGDQITPDKKRMAITNVYNLVRKEK